MYTFAFTLSHAPPKGTHYQLQEERRDLSLLT